MTRIVRSGGVRTACTVATGGGPAYGGLADGGVGGRRLPIGTFGDVADVAAG